MSGLRALSVAGLLAVAVAALLPLQLLALWFGWPLRRSLPRLFHRMACGLIGLRITVIGTPPRGAPTLIVANHCSWIDILAISATLPVVFIAKREVSSWPVLGWFARLQRAVFVDRGRRSATGEVNAQIGRRLADGDHVVLFAEGTSSDGTRVLPFKSALVGAAGHAHGRSPVAVQPLAIAYTRRHGIRIGRHERHAVAWYGAMRLWPHLVRVLGRGAIDLTLTWGPPILYRPGSDRKAVTREIEATVRTLTAAALAAA